MNTSTYTNLSRVNSVPISVFLLYLLLVTTTQAQNPSALHIQCPTQLSIPIYGNSCVTVVHLPQPVAQSGCQGAIQVSVDSPWGLGTGPFTNVAAGTYLVKLYATDACGAKDSCSYNVVVEDKRAPKAILVQTLYANLNTDGQAVVIAAQCNQGSYDNCTSSQALRFAFSADVQDTLRRFECDDLGVNQLPIYVFDAEGNKTSGITNIEVMDVQKVCNQKFWLAAKVQTPSGHPISAATFSVKQNDVQVYAGESDHDGTIEATPWSNTHKTVIECAHWLDPLNGVSTLDLYFLQRYILGLDSLSPWQLIAADANLDDKVTASDLTAIRKLILGVNSSFPHNHSWRFVPADHQFVNYKNPFQPTLPKEITYPAGQTGAALAHWNGVKIGDIDMSSIPNLQSHSQSRNHFPMNSSSVQLKIQDAFLKSGEVTHVPVYLESHTQLAGFQFALKVVSQYLDVLEIKPETSMQQDLYTHLLKDEGTINTSYTGQLEAAQRTNLFTVSVLPKNDGFASDFITLSNTRMAPEAFNKSGTMFNIQLDYAHPYMVPVLESDTNPITMIGNSPNPFVEMTILHFALDRATHATLRVFDTDGALVHTQNGFFEKGAQMFLLKKEDLGHTGVYHCRIDTELGSVTRKVIMF